MHGRIGARKGVDDGLPRTRGTRTSERPANGLQYPASAQHPPARLAAGPSRVAAPAPAPSDAAAAAVVAAAAAADPA